MRAWLPPTAAVALLAAAAVLMSGEDPGGPRASQPQARRAAPSEPPPALLAELEGAQQTAEVETLAALPVSEARSAVASEAGDTQEPGAVGGPDLHGFVRDASGRAGRFAGLQFDARLRHALRPWLRLELDAVLLDKGRFLRDAPNATRGAWTRYVSTNLMATF